MSIIHIKPDGSQVNVSRPKRNADQEGLMFCRKGEFSPWADVAFLKHLKRLERVSHQPQVQRMNGEKMKFIRTVEGFWY